MDAKLFTLLIFPVLMIIIVIIKSSVRDEKEDKQRIIDEFYNGKPNIIQERINKLYDKLENQNDKHE
jgi:hypothetical protein